MVGHHKGEHHVAEGISEEGYQQWVDAWEGYNLAQYSIEEYPGVAGEKHQDDSYDDLRGVVVEELYDGIVEKIERIFEIGEQGMTVDLVLGFPFGEDAVGDGVESRHGVFIHE